MTEKNTEFDPQNIIDRLPEYTSQKICSMIICDRYLGIDENLAIACMEELGKRRSLGDDFDFESYIDEKLNELPKLDFSMPDLRSMLGSMISGVNK